MDRGEYRPLPVRCDKCLDMGWVKVFVGPAAWNHDVRRCECGQDEDKRQQWQRARRLSDMAQAQYALTFANYDGRYNKDTAYHVECWAHHPDTPPRWLVLWGKPGTGKSHLLSAAFNVMVDSNILPLYCVWPNLLDHIREGISAGNYGERFAAILDAPVLLLDDMGAENRTPWTDEAAYKLLDHRYRHELPTAVAMNIHPSELEPRVASRLGDLAVVRTCQMSGPDYRQSGVRAARAQQQQKGTDNAGR